MNLRAMTQLVGPQSNAQPRLDQASPIAQLSQVSAVRDGRTIWRDLDLCLAAGEIVAVIGPNGAGKSTLLQVLLGLHPLGSGSLSLFGHPPRRGDPAIGYVPQRQRFEPDLRIRGRDLVRLGLDGMRWGFPLPVLLHRRATRHQLRADARRVQDAIAMVGASDFADRPIGELSGGEQQRLIIAQAIVTRPRLLLLDEPLEGLDLQSQQAIVTLLQWIAGEQSVTALLVAHDVNPIAPLLDRVVYLVSGRCAVGRPDEVITADTLSRLYGAPIDVLHTQDGRVIVVGRLEGFASDAG